MASDRDYVKIYRKLLENPITWKDNDYLAMWIYLLLTVEWKERDVEFDNNRITLKPGQGIYGRKKLAGNLKISESKCERILTLLKNEQQIEQQTTSKNRLITILNWSSYQKSEQRNGQPMDNERTTSEQPVDTNKEYKEFNKYKNKDINMLNTREANNSQYAGLSTEEAYQIICKKPFSQDLTDEEEKIVKLHDKIRDEGWKRAV